MAPEQTLAVFKKAYNSSVRRKLISLKMEFLKNG